ncbi:hypothetical protein HID58_001019 [Brassica napus]|uniref:Uncharacterized protein n=1 Tax=Brassica napus TaxID=3708 RepID=A0ABQ8EI77_BRANA|nr:hypothetical protein HID58_001019 [Brassica napus]
MSTVCLLLRQEREYEKRRLREQKKVQEQPHVEQDTAFSTRPSPARPVSAKKPVGARASNGGANGRPNRRLSLNANQNGSRSVAKEGGRSVCNFAFDDGNFILELDVGMKNGCIDLGFEDQPDTVTFSEGYQDISRSGIKQEGCESGVWHYNIRMRPNVTAPP